MTRQRQEKNRAAAEPGNQSGEDGRGSNAQSGDAQGLSQEVDAAEESVRELVAEGQDYEAQILKGVEDATDHRRKPVPDHGGH